MHTDYEGEYETDDSDYIANDEDEYENALWDDEEVADNLPEKSEESERTKLFLLIMIRIPKKTTYPNRSDGRLQKKNNSSKNWKLPALLDKVEKQQPMTLLEKDFLEESGIEIDSGKKK